MCAPDEAQSILANVTNRCPIFSRLANTCRIANNEKKYDDALRLVENALSRDAGEHRCALVQAESWIAKGETKRRWIRRESGPYLPWKPCYKICFGSLVPKTNNLSDAIAAVDQAVKTNPHFVDAVLLQAELHLKNGDAQSVVRSLSAVVKQSPGPFTG